MSRNVVLHGYRFSVYHRIVRVVLAEKRIEYTVVEINPFARDLPASYLRRHPFGRVPVLSHGDFSLYETSAITRYLDQAFDGPSLTPSDPEAVARMSQVIAIVDAYGYWPMIREVFAHRVFRPLQGETPDDAEIAAGLRAASTVLKALDDIVGEGKVLNGSEVTLADCHLAPMLDYFAAAPEGAAALGSCCSLGDWWARLSLRPSLIATAPGRPQTAPG